MDYQKAISIYSLIKNTSIQNLKSDLVESAVRYSRLRVEWRLVEPEERKYLDNERIIAHNSFIDSCNILSRNMAKASEDIS